MRLPMILVCVCSAGVLATQAVAAEVLAFSKIDDANRVLEVKRGEIKSWSWKNGVEVVSADDKSVSKVDVSVIIDVIRGESDRPDDFNKAIWSGNVAGLAAVAAGAKNPIDQQDAHWELCKVKRGQAALDELKAFTAKWSDSIFLDRAYMLMGKLLNDAKKQDEALKAYEDCAKLGVRPRMNANIEAGRILSAQSKFKEAAAKFEAAASDAAKVLHSVEQMLGLALAGEAAQANKDSAKAKSNFEAVFKVNDKFGFSPEARGLANKGLGELGGNTEEAYNYLIKGAYWLEGDPKEGDCIVGAWKIAKANANPSETKWTERAKKLEEKAQALWADKLKAAQGGKG